MILKLETLFRKSDALGAYGLRCEEAEVDE
jgi:hypothetical protein